MSDRVPGTSRKPVDVVDLETEYSKFIGDCMPPLTASIGECLKCKQHYAWIDKHAITSSACPDCGDAVKLTPLARDDDHWRNYQGVDV